MTYRIKSVSALTGVSAATLRAWERRYDLVVPERTAGGYRLYTDGDVERLRRIKELVDHGYKVSEAIGLVQRGERGARAEPPSVEPLRDRLHAALLELDRTRAGELGEALSRLPLEAQMEQVLFPILHRIGAMWARGEATIVQEHFASAFAHERLAAMLESLGAGPVGGPEAVCAGVPGEGHELGLLAAAVHLAMRGWRVTYLGPDVPFPELEATLHVRRPALVCASLMRATSEADCMELARGLRAIVPPGTGVLLGGAGVPASLVGIPCAGVQLTRRFPERVEGAG